MIWVCAGLLIVCGVQQYVHYLNQAKWMRMFAESRGIPVPVMEGKPEEKTVVQVPPRKRISIPLPYASAFRASKNPDSMKQ